MSYTLITYGPSDYQLGDMKGGVVHIHHITTADRPDTLYWELYPLVCAAQTDYVLISEVVINYPRLPEGSTKDVIYGNQVFLSGGLSATRVLNGVSYDDFVDRPARVERAFVRKDALVAFIQRYLGRRNINPFFVLCFAATHKGTAICDKTLRFECRNKEHHEREILNTRQAMMSYITA